MSTFTNCADELICATLSGSNGIDVNVVTGTPDKIVVSANNIPNSALASGGQLQINSTVFTLGQTGSLTIGNGTVNSGLQGYVAYYPNNGTTVDDTSCIFTNNTSVGIGTTNLTDKLTVIGNISSSNDLFVGDDITVGDEIALMTDDSGVTYGNNSLAENGAVGESKRYPSYEVGTWIPEFSSSYQLIDNEIEDGVQFIYSDRSGSYVRNGNQVFLTGYMKVKKSVFSEANEIPIFLINLPFPCGSSVNGGLNVNFFLGLQNTTNFNGNPSGVPLPSKQCFMLLAPIIQGAVTATYPILSDMIYTTLGEEGDGLAATYLYFTAHYITRDDKYLGPNLDNPDGIIGLLADSFTDGGGGGGGGPVTHGGG